MYFKKIFVLFCMVCFSLGGCKQSKKFKDHCLVNQVSALGQTDLGSNSASATHQPDDLEEDALIL